MSRKKLSRYTQEFKREAAALVIEQGYKQIEVSHRLGVSPKNVNRWVQEYRAHKSGLSQSNEPQELARLQAEVKRLEQERDILKKAAAFFANENP